MSSASTQDLAFCRERSFRSDSTLALSLRYAIPELREALLILHTIVGEICSIPFRTSQVEPALAKLAWWQSALSDARTHPPQHPAIRAARDNGVLDKIDQNDVADLINGVAAISTGEPVTDQDSLREHALNIGGTAARMEQRLESLPVDRHTSLAGLTDFMCKCLGNFDRKLAGESWWLPMDVQANLGLNWQRLPGNRLPEPFVDAMKMQATRALESIDAMLSDHERNALTTRLGRHLFVSTSLNHRRIADIAANPPSRWPMRNRPADSILAWKQALKHRRSSRHSERPMDGR